MKLNDLKILTIATLALLTSLPAAAQQIFTTYIPGLANDEGRFNYGRVRITSTLDGTALGQWNFAGLVGVTTGGEVWHGFGRYQMSQRDLFNTVNTGEQITVTTGLVAKTRGSERNNAYGIPVEVFLVLDPNGQIVPEGSEPDIFSAWDWADELGLGYSNKVSLGVIQPGDYDMADQATLVEYPSDPGKTGLTVDHPAMQIMFDITGPLKGWINDGLLTANSTIAIGFVQRLGTIVDGQGNPDPLNPSLLPVQNEFMLFEVVNMHLTVGDAQANTWAGYAVRTDGWVDTGAFLGLVYPTGDWVWSASLGKYIYLPEGNVSAAGAWAHILK